MAKINKLLSNTSIDRRSYTTGGAAIMLEIQQAYGFANGEAHHYLVYFVDKTTDKYILAEIFFQYGTICSYHTVASYGLSIAASNTQGTVVIAGNDNNWGNISVCSIPCRW